MRIWCTKPLLFGTVLIHGTNSLLGQNWGRQYVDFRNITDVNEMTPMKLVSSREDSAISCAAKCQKIGCIYIHFDAETKVCEGYHGEPPIQGYLWKRGCPVNYKYNQTYDICYIIHDQSSWNDAKKTCESEGSILFIVNTESRENFLRHLFNQVFTRFWIGASDVQHESDWKWIDGTVLQNKAFADNYNGNENCLEMVRIQSDPYFNDYICEQSLNFICAH